MGSAAAKRLPAAARLRAAMPAAVAAAAAPQASSGTMQQEQWLFSLDWLTHASAGSQAVALAAETAAMASGMQLAVTGSAASSSAAAAAIAVGQQAVASSLQSLALLTRGAQSAACTAPAAAAPAAAHSAQVQAAGLWALARTMAQELTTFDVQALDLQQQAAAPEGTAAMLLAPAGSAPALLPPAARLDSSPYGHAAEGGSLVAATLQRSAVKLMLPPFQLFPQPRGALQNLAPLAVDATSSLAPGQVLVAVKAVGINFRQAEGWHVQTGRETPSCASCTF